MSCSAMDLHCVFKCTYGFFFQQLLSFISLIFESSQTHTRVTNTALSVVASTSCTLHEVWGMS